MENDTKAFVKYYKDRGLYNPRLNYIKGVEDFNQAIKDNDKEKIKDLLTTYGGVIGLSSGASLQKLDKSNNQSL